MEYRLPSKDLLGKQNLELEGGKIYYSLGEVVYNKDFIDKLVFPVGIDENKEKWYMDFLPKSGLLIAGETGSGKSMFIHSIIISLLLKNFPNELEFVFIDPRGSELGVYNKIPHLYNHVFKGKEESLEALNYVSTSLLNRRNLFDSKNVKNIIEYNENTNDKLPQMILIIDEAIDIIDSVEAGNIINDILIDGFNYGIHIILATNAYFETYFDKKEIEMFKNILSFDLSSKKQADYIKVKKSNLLGANGDALIKYNDDKLLDIQTPFVSNYDIENIVNFIINQE